MADKDAATAQAATLARLRGLCRDVDLKVSDYILFMRAYKPDGQEHAYRLCKAVDAIALMRAGAAEAAKEQGHE